MNDTIYTMDTMNLIENNHDLAEWVDRITHSDWIAIDTEFFRERTYGPELCLVQIAAASSDKSASQSEEIQTACIDPLAITELSPLANLFVNPRVTKIFHSCRQDLEALDTRITDQIHNLYDTQLAAAFCGYGDSVGYAKLVDSICSVYLPKAHTRANWRQRPLPQALLEYAVDDVKYLQPLRQQLDDMLAEKGRSEWHREECLLATAPDNYRYSPESAWQQLKGFSRLDTVSQICAQKLAAWREQRAYKKNLPRGWVLPTPVLMRICREKPSTIKKLGNIKEISEGVVKRSGKEIIALIQQSESEAPEKTHAPMPALTPEQRDQVKKILHALGQFTEQAEISKLLLANRQDIERFVCGETDLPLFKGWRAKLIGDEIRERYS